MPCISAMLLPMTALSIDLPEGVFSALRLSPEEAARELRLIAAMHWYAQGAVSQEKAAEIAGLDRPDFIRALAKREVPVFHVDVAEVRAQAVRD
jgi:predicted HTH domain antitoxin